MVAIIGVATALVVSTVSGGLAVASANTTERGLPPLPRSIVSRGHFVIGVKCDVPPFGYIDAQKRHAGYDVLVAQRLSELAFHQSDRVTYVCVTTTSRIPTLQNRRVDMLIATLSWTKARAKEIGYSAPYFEETGRLLVRTGGGVASVANLGGKSVVTTHGSVYVSWAAACLKGTTVQQVDNTSAAVSAVAGGQASGFLYDGTFLEGVTAANPALTLTSDGFLRLPWGIGVRKNDAALRRWIDAALAQMKAGDQLYELAAESGLSGTTINVPRPQVTIGYPLHTDPLTDCGTN